MAKKSKKVFAAPANLQRAISPYDEYCDGFSSPGEDGLGYISLLKVATGTTIRTDDPVLDGIIAYDRAECTGSYIGQINMITASSFSGLAGQLWGYDLAQHDDIATQEPEFSIWQYDGTTMACYDAAPLLNAAERLFGTVDARRFPLVPGAHTICANKNASAYRPAEGQELQEGEAYGIWSIISISIARNREQAADLFIEDAGLWTENDNEADLVAFLEGRKRLMANCSVSCGADSRVTFDKSYIGYAYTIMEPGYMGEAIVVGPYVTLAQNAVPAAGFEALNTLKLSEWEAEMNFS